MLSPRERREEQGIFPPTWQAASALPQGHPGGDWGGGLFTLIETAIKSVSVEPQELEGFGHPTTRE